jgi:hypothetical protein
VISRIGQSIANGTVHFRIANIVFMRRRLLKLFAQAAVLVSQTRSIATNNQCKNMIRRVPNSKLGVSEPNPSWFGNPANDKQNPSWTNSNWLKSRFHFSFAEYSNPANMGFGVLRVMNDDLVQPSRGFGEHPHRDTEICTYVVEGETHISWSISSLSISL